MSQNQFNLPEELANLYSLLLGLYGLATLEETEKHLLKPLLAETFKTIQSKLLELLPLLDQQTAGQILASLKGSTYVEPDNGDGDGSGELN